MLDADEYSVYSDETISNALGISSKSIANKSSSFAKRKSGLQTAAPETKVIVKNTVKADGIRRNTVLMRKDTTQRDMNALTNNPILEVDDFSETCSSDDSSDTDIRLHVKKESDPKVDESDQKMDKEVPLFSKENSVNSNRKANISIQEVPEPVSADKISKFEEGEGIQKHGEEREQVKVKYIG
jgi:hypothetical protein